MIRFQLFQNNYMVGNNIKIYTWVFECTHEWVFECLCDYFFFILIFFCLCLSSTHYNLESCLCSSVMVIFFSFLSTNYAKFVMVHIKKVAWRLFKFAQARLHPQPSTDRVNNLKTLCTIFAQVLTNLSKLHSLFTLSLLSAKQQLWHAYSTPSWAKECSI